MRTGEVNPFSPRAGRWLAGGALVSLLAAFWLLLTPSTGPGIGDVGAHGYSRSALGHFALIRLLRELGEPVVQLRRARDLGDCGLLVLAEPREVRYQDDAQVERWLRDVPATLLVLPKRYGERDPEQPDWVAQTGLLTEADVASVLHDLERWTEAPAPELVRSDVATGWESTYAWPLPTVVAPVQLLRDDYGAVLPLVSGAQGVRLGRIGGVHVLPDRDVIANHGLARGDNAEFAVRLVRELRGVGGPADADPADQGVIVFDETLHGHAVEPSIWHLAGQFPHVLIPAHLLLSFALVLWAARGRFGAPLPLAPAFGAGKRFLIDNVAALLARGAHHGPALRRYGRQRVRAAAERLHAPRGLSDEQCCDWLLRRLPDADRRRRLEALLSRTGAASSARDATAVAREIRTLTQEESHGAG